MILRNADGLLVGSVAEHDHHQQTDHKRKQNDYNRRRFDSETARYGCARAMNRSGGRHRQCGGLDLCELLDIAQSLQPLLHNVLGRGATFVGGKNLLDFLLQHMQDKLVHGFVTAGIGALLRLVQQYSFNLHFVRAKHDLSSATVPGNPNTLWNRAEKLTVPSYPSAFQFQTPRGWSEKCRSGLVLQPRSSGC